MVVSAHRAAPVAEANDLHAEVLEEDDMDDERELAMQWTREWLSGALGPEDDDAFDSHPTAEARRSQPNAMFGLSPGSSRRASEDRTWVRSKISK